MPDTNQTAARFAGQLPKPERKQFTPEEKLKKAQRELARAKQIKERADLERRERMFYIIGAAAPMLSSSAVDELKAAVLRASTTALDQRASNEWLSTITTKAT